MLRVGRLSAARIPAHSEGAGGRAGGRQGRSGPCDVECLQCRFLSTSIDPRVVLAFSKAKACAPTATAKGCCLPQQDLGVSLPGVVAPQGFLPSRGRAAVGVFRASAWHDRLHHAWLGG